MTVELKALEEHRPTGEWAEAIESRRSVARDAPRPLVRRVAWTYRTGAAWPHPAKADPR